MIPCHNMKHERWSKGARPAPSPKPERLASLSPGSPESHEGHPGYGVAKEERKPKAWSKPPAPQQRFREALLGSLGRWRCLGFAPPPLHIPTQGSARSSLIPGLRDASLSGLESGLLIKQAFPGLIHCLI